MSQPASDPNDFTNRYNTVLTPRQEAMYQRWLQTLPVEQRSTYDYDLRGAFLSDAVRSGTGHLPDTFKKPNHPTFSTESQYSGMGDFVGGTWSGDDKSGWTFTASPTNLNFHPTDKLLDYFKRVEPKSKLVTPKAQP